MSTETLSEKTKNIPKASGGIPLIGNTVEMAKDPAAFFLRCYRNVALEGVLGRFPNSYGGFKITHRSGWCRTPEDEKYYA